MATLIIFYGHWVHWDLSTWPNKPHDSYLDLKKRHQHLHERHRTHPCLLKLSMDKKYIGKRQHILLPHKVHTSKPAWPRAPGLSASGLETPLERLRMTQRARGTAVTTDALIVILQTAASGCLQWGQEKAFDCLKLITLMCFHVLNYLCVHFPPWQPGQKIQEKKKVQAGKSPQF